MTEGTTMILEQLQKMNSRLDCIDVRLDKVDDRLDKMEVRLDKMDDRLDKMEVRLDKMDDRLDKMEVRLDNMDDRLDKMDGRLDRMDLRMDRMDSRQERLEEAMGELKLVVENELRDYITIIAEGHLDLNRKLDEALRGAGDREMMKLRLNVLEGDVRRLKKVVGVTDTST